MKNGQVIKTYTKHLKSFALHQKQNNSVVAINSFFEVTDKSQMRFKLICWYFSWHRNQPEIKDTVVTEDLLT